MAQDGFQDGPRGPKTAPRRLQGASEAPKEAPKMAKILPRPKENQCFWPPRLFASDGLPRPQGSSKRAQDVGVFLSSWSYQFAALWNFVCVGIRVSGGSRAGKEACESMSGAGRLHGYDIVISVFRSWSAAESALPRARQATACMRGR